MYRVALIGWGMSAKTFHLPYILASKTLSLVAMVTSQQQACADTYPDVACFSTLDALIAGAAIDLAIVATPNHLHFQQALALLNAGIPVVVDKPATLTTSDIVELFDVAAANGVWLAVYHNRRWDGDFMGLREAVTQERLGSARVFINQFDRFRPVPRDRWREQAIEGAGIWYDLGPHLVDQAMCLFGRPTSISANLRKLRDHTQNIDYFQVSLHYPQLEVVLRSSPFCTDPMLRFQLETDQGTWRKFGLDPQEAQLKTGMLPNTDAWFDTLPREFARWSEEGFQENHALPAGDYGGFYRTVERALAGAGQQALVVTPQQAIDVATVIDTAMDSEEQSNRIDLVWYNRRSI
ncbi:MAG TPA: Gfo/Idh/MocA family oxidoreductase [Pseudomonadales bacterium]|nr:Gfo/Idh/MocA family oxidoreductase [Pseudomonadales bacterium]